MGYGTNTVLNSQILTVSKSRKLAQKSDSLAIIATNHGKGCASHGVVLYELFDHPFYKHADKPTGKKTVSESLTVAQWSACKDGSLVCFEGHYLARKTQEHELNSAPSSAYQKVGYCRDAPRRSLS